MKQEEVKRRMNIPCKYCRDFMQLLGRRHHGMPFVAPRIEKVEPPQMQHCLYRQRPDQRIHLIGTSSGQEIPRGSLETLLFTLHNHFRTSASPVFECHVYKRVE